MVGEPKFLHPSTASKTNLDVAKVFTIIDLRKPLPEAVNVQFESGEIKGVFVSTLWMPPVFSHCKEVVYSVKRCKKAYVLCDDCKSTAHVTAKCPRAKAANGKKIRSRKNQVDTNIFGLSLVPLAPSAPGSVPSVICRGESNARILQKPKMASTEKNIVTSAEEDLEADSSNLPSSDSEDADSVEERGIGVHILSASSEFHKGLKIN